MGASGSASGSAPGSTDSRNVAGNTPRACGIVAGHADFPAGLVSAVAQITGRGDVLVPFSNAGLGRDEIEAGLRAALARSGARVIFTDLLGGSATLAARRIMHDVPDLTLVTGVTLASLVDFVFCDGTVPPDEAARRAVDKGRAAMTVATGG